MHADDLPILGESLAIDLANTLYGEGDDAFDFFASPALVALWLAHAMPAPHAKPADPSEQEAAALRELRDAVRALALALWAHTPPPAEAVATVNQHAAAGCAYTELGWTAEQPASARVHFRGPTLVQARAKLATACVELCTQTREGAVRRCEGPGCSLLFVQHDRRRRFCHPSCSHRARQRKYWSKP